MHATNCYTLSPGAHGTFRRPANVQQIQLNRANIKEPSNPSKSMCSPEHAIVQQDATESHFMPCGLDNYVTAWATGRCCALSCTCRGMSQSGRQSSQLSTAALMVSGICCTPQSAPSMPQQMAALVSVSPPSSSTWAHALEA